MLVVCLLNPQRGVSGSPFINNMTSDLLIRPFNLKFYKKNNILLVSTGKSYCTGSSKAFVMFVSLSCKATEEFGIILSGMVKLTATPFHFKWFDLS